MLFTTTAYAMGGSGAAGGEAAGFAGFIPLILMFAVFYFLLIRPQQKRAKEHKAMLSALHRGDQVVTLGGLYGTILETADEYLVLDLGDTKVKVSRAAVSAVVPGGNRQNDKKSKKNEAKDAEPDSADK